MFSRLVQLAAGFTWDSLQEAGAAPQLHQTGPVGSLPSTAPQGHGEGAVGQGEHSVPLLCPAANGRAAVGQMGVMEAWGKLAPWHSFRNWPQAHAGMGCSLGEALLQDVFQKVRGGRDAGVWGDSSSSTCSGTCFIDTATGTAEDRHGQ